MAAPLRLACAARVWQLVSPEGTLRSVLVLLPPSETKSAPPRRGRPVDLDALSFPALNPLRERVLDALAMASGQDDALARLGVGAASAAQVERNTRARELPAVPVSSLYRGVLYDALDWAGLPVGARRRGATRVIVVSALWGALRPADRVPAYRLSMSVDLPGVGPLGRAWRGVLGAELATAAGDRGLVVDCRSTTYAQAWAPSGALAARTVAVRVLRDARPAAPPEAPSAGPRDTPSPGPLEAQGERTVVSHLAKHTRGEVTRHLLASDRDPRTPAQLADLLRTRWSGERGQVELVAPTRPGRPWTVDVVLPWRP